MVAVEPILDADIEGVARFLNEQMNPAIPVEKWRRAFENAWTSRKPNNGFMILDGGSIGGVFGAIYSEQVIRGKTHRFCNLTSWCVLPSYRNLSLLLLRKILGQEGWHFTDLTATPDAAAVMTRLGFMPLDGTRTVIPFLPLGRGGGAAIIGDPKAMEEALDPPAAKAFADHRGFEGFGHLCIACGGADTCYVVYKRRRWRRIRYADILHLSRPDLFLQHRRAFGRHLLRTELIWAIVVERRLLPCRPFPSFEFEPGHKKLFLGEALGPADIGNLYSELIALNM